ncbi:hypothetical protein MPSEU_001038400 [Mayamaea pseudoterrestris]|nr:hypothetical protein MPSEU_001038400 [Mayamaea pseudoterrestris]
MSDAAQIQLQRGDYVLLTAGEHDGKYGYMLDWACDYDSQQTARHRVVIDEIFSYSSSPIRKRKPLVVKKQGKDLELIRTMMTSIRLSICDFVATKFPCHGFATSKKPLKLDLETPYGKMNRPSIKELPGIQREDSVFIDTASESLYRDIFHGTNLVVEWMHVFPDDLTLEACSPLFVATLFEKQADGNLVEVGLVTFCPEVDKRSKALSHEISDDLSDPRFQKLTPSQNRALVARVFHMICRLSGHELGISTFRYVTSYLNELYLGRECMEESLDLAVILADMDSQTRSKRCLAIQLTRVATCMEACSMFHEAALLYGQVADFYKAEKRKDDPVSLKFEKSLLPEILDREVCERCAQGRAYTSGRAWANGEGAFVAAFSRIFKSLPLNDAINEPMLWIGIDCLLKLYQGWVSDLPDGAAAEIVNDVWHLFAAAVNIFITADDSEGTAHRIHEHLNDRRRMTKTLQKAFMAGSVSSFRAAVCAWKRPNLVIPIRRIACDSDKAMQEARNTMFDGCDPRKLALSCGNENCESAEQYVEQHKLLKCTQCRSIQYCSRTCQKADWKMHKAYCKRIAAKLAETKSTIGEK